MVFECPLCDRKTPHPTDLEFHLGVLREAGQREIQTRPYRCRAPERFHWLLAAIAAHQGSAECLLFTGGRNKAGYGVFACRGKRLAHRMAYAAANGIDIAEIDDLVVCHRCDTPACINPRHLRLGTQADNLRDMFAKGRQQIYRSGPDNVRAKLSAEQVAYMRSAWISGDKTGFGAKGLARKFGVSPSAVRSLLHGLTHKNITPAAPATAAHTANAPRKAGLPPAASRSTARAPGAR